jgi:hypothetical protein
MMNQSRVHAGSHNTRREALNLDAANGLPFELTANLVGRLALTVPLEHEVVEGVAEGDQPAREAAVGVRCGTDGSRGAARV